MDKENRSSMTQTLSTAVFEGQKPGTSGLRKKVKVFQQPNYLENFIQATFTAYGEEQVEGKDFVVGGDGRYYSPEAAQTICEIAGANGVKKVYVGMDTLMCTPAVSCFVRKHQCSGAILLTASHNPGGPEEDFGVKFNCANGGPAPEKVTNKIFEICNTIQEYKRIKLPPLDFTKPGKVYDEAGFEIEVVDPVKDYVEMLEGIFNMDLIKSLFSREDFKFCIDGMNGVAGPYAKKMFTEVLGKDSCMRCDPMPDFGGCHPDPNLVYAKELVDLMYSGASAPTMGAACDGDADRNMVLGHNFFVNPSDSVAIITAYAKQCIPYFKDLTGVARSMPTSSAIDRVAKKQGIECFETPTGWKFFGNLMDSGKIQICGEESFGTGGDHVREKDGLWAILCWLSIVAFENQDSSKPFKHIKQIVNEFWAEYGRCFYSRYDYENVETEGANKMIAHLLSQTPETINQAFAADVAGNPCVTVDNFCYTDPVDGSVSANQGVRVVLEDGSRVVFRLSGTGSSGATIRMYIESYCNDSTKIEEDPQLYLKPLISFGLKVSQLQELSGRDTPTVIT